MLAACMFLSTLSVLMMFSMQDPLNDEMKGISMGQGVIVGVLACLLFQGVDFIKFYQNNCFLGYDIPMEVFCWFFKPYRQKTAGLTEILINESAGKLKKIFAIILIVLSSPLLLLDILRITQLNGIINKICKKLPKGIGWLILALMLTSLLWTPLGGEVGGMKVNLKLPGFTFQPSEIAKYLILMFVAAFFTQRADAIIAYSRPKMISLLGSKIKTLLWIIAGLTVLLAMYVKLGDMGPGLVIVVTFILLYSFIKSKVNLDNLDEKDRWKKIFSCDFAILF